jgi:hypothetical protein
MSETRNSRSNAWMESLVKATVRERFVGSTKVLF